MKDEMLNDCLSYKQRYIFIVLKIKYYITSLEYRHN